MACCVAPSVSNSHTSGTDPRLSGLSYRNVTSTPSRELAPSKQLRKSRPKKSLIQPNSNERSPDGKIYHVSVLGENRERFDSNKNKFECNGKEQESSACSGDEERYSEDQHLKIKHTRNQGKPSKMDVEGDTGESSEGDGSNDDCEDEKKYQCTVCHQRFQRPWRLKAHMNIHSLKHSFKCDFKGCNKAYNYKHHLDRHKSISHADLVITVSKIKCPVPECGAVLASALTLKKHMGRQHDESNFNYPCSECGKKFKKHKQLSVHLMEHTNEPPFRCDVCGVGSVSEAALKEHLKRHKEHHCTIPGCNMTFPNFSLLRKHKADHNTCFSSMKCAHCDKVYSNRASMVEHVMTHINEGSKVHQCPHEGCSRVYYQKRNLNHHIRFFHERKTKFMCPWEGCGQPCHSGKRLEKHLNVHKNGKAPNKPSDKPRAKRKDAGQKKRAAAVLLSGFPIPREMEKTLLVKTEVEEDALSETSELKIENNLQFVKDEVDPLSVVKSVLPVLEQGSILAGLENKAPSETSPLKPDPNPSELLLKTQQGRISSDSSPQPGLKVNSSYEGVSNVCSSAALGDGSSSSNVCSETPAENPGCDGAVQVLLILPSCDQSDGNLAMDSSISNDTEVQMIMEEPSVGLKESTAQEHLESDREELQGPSKDSDEDNDVSEENSSGSQGEDSDSDDDSEFLPDEENGNEFSGDDDDDDGGEGGGDEDEDDDEDEDEDQDELHEEDDDDEEEDDEDGGANQGEQNQNDDNNNSDNVNCDSPNESGRQMDSNTNDGTFNIGDGSETGLDRSQGNFEADHDVGIKTNKTDKTTKKSTVSSQQNINVKQEHPENSEAKPSDSAQTSTRSLRSKPQQEHNPQKEEGSPLSDTGKGKVSLKKTSPSNESSNKDSPPKKPNNEKKRPFNGSSDLSIPAKKRRSTRASDSVIVPQSETTSKLKPSYKVCSGFSEDTWISTLRKASKAMNFAGIPKD